MKLKLSPITHLSDARFAAAAGFDYMGFCFDPGNADFVLPIKAKEIIDWTTGSHTVGEFGDQEASEIGEIAEILGLDVVLLNNRILPDELPQIAKPIIKYIDVNVLGEAGTAKELTAYATYCDAFQLKMDTFTSNLLDSIKNWNSTYQLILDIGNDFEVIKSVMNVMNPYAINLHAGSEEKIGLKDFDELNNLLDQLKLIE